MILRRPTSQRITMKRHGKERHPKMSIGSKEPIFPNVYFGYFGCGHIGQQKYRTLPWSWTTWTRTREVVPGSRTQAPPQDSYQPERKSKLLSHVWLCDPMDCIVHGILQVRILKWGAIPFSRGSSQPKDRTQVSHIAGRFFTSWAMKEAQEYWSV